MSDRRRRPRMTVRRLLAYALVPLSALPFALAAPVVAPSIEKRVQHLSDQPATPVRAPARGGAPAARSAPGVGQRHERRVAKPAQRPLGE